MGKRSIQEIVFSVFFILVSIPAFIMTYEMPARAKIFPRFASGAMFVFGAALLITNIVTAKKTTKEAVKIVRSPIVVYCIILVYVILIPIIGFFISSIVMMIVFMLYMNIRSIKTFLIAIPVLMAFLYVVFVWQLRVPLPRGFLF